MKSRSNKGQSSMCMNCLGNFPDRCDHPDENSIEGNLFEIFFSLRFLLPDYFVLVFSCYVDSKASRW